MQTTLTVARVNNVDIQIIKNGEKLIPVKPICQALGIAFEVQLRRLKSDPILNSVVTTRVTTGADGKQYEMTVIPYRYVFGWLFRIDSRNVKEEAREAVERYQLECYDALFNHFTRHEEFLEYRDTVVEEKLAIYDAARSDFRMAKERVAEARAELDEIRKLTEADYFANKRQLAMEFPDSVVTPGITTESAGKEATNE